MGSKARSSQDSTQQTTQTDNRIGASDNAIVGTYGAKIGSTETTIDAGRDITVNSLDPNTIAGAFGLTEAVTNRLADIVGQTVQGGQNLAERISGQTTGSIERISDAFGRQVSGLATTQTTGGTNQFTKIVLAVIVAAVVIFYVMRRKPGT